MQAEPTPSWSEENSQTFLDYGRYFVPEREHQLAIIATLIPPRDEPFTVVELCCGEGLLAETILKQRPTSTILGYDGSPAMLEKARQRLAAFGERFQTRHFDLTAPTWRQFEQPVHAVVSSLAIHHLDGAEKQALFVDIYNLLAPGGVFVIADVILPTHKQGWQVAAAAWDRAVMARAQALDGHLAAFEAFRDTEWNMYRGSLPDEIDKPSTLRQQLGWLEAAGFDAVDVHWMDAGHAIFSGVKGC